MICPSIQAAHVPTGGVLRSCMDAMRAIARSIWHRHGETRMLDVERHLSAAMTRRGARNVIGS